MVNPNNGGNIHLFLVRFQDVFGQAGSNVCTRHVRLLTDSRSHGDTVDDRQPKMAYGWNRASSKPRRRRVRNSVIEGSVSGCIIDH